MKERTDPVNWSTLKEILRSPRHYRYLLEHPREDTDALRLGRLTHAVVYEPDTVSDLYVRQPRFHGGMKDETATQKGYDGGREAKAAWEAEHAEHTIISDDLWSRAHGMCAALHSDPIAAPLVTGGYAEQTIGWIDARTGIECRGRVDHLNGRLSDLKTARAVDLRLVASQAARLHYYAQIAWYYDGCIACGIEFTAPPAIVAVESMPPHDVVVMEFAEEDLATGRQVYMYALSVLWDCRHADAWPGVAGGKIQRAQPPAWYGMSDEEPMSVIVDGEEVQL